MDSKVLKKNGVFAVRSGKPLAKSIKNYILNHKNFTYKFNKNYLSLIGLSNGLAIASKYNFSYSTKLNLYLKKYIDQRFIKKFNELNYNQISKFNSDSPNIELGINHKEYTHTTKLTEDNIKSLRADFI